MKANPDHQPDKPEDQAAALEKRIRDAAREVPGVTFGYIGNFERWGDDRQLHLWIEERDANGNQISLWVAEAKSLTRADMSRAQTALRIFHLGVKAGQANPHS